MYSNFYAGLIDDKSVIIGEEHDYIQKGILISTKIQELLNSSVTGHLKYDFFHSLCTMLEKNY